MCMPPLIARKAIRKAIRKSILPALFGKGSDWALPEIPNFLACWELAGWLLLAC